VDRAVPESALSALRDSLCPIEWKAMLRAAREIVTPVRRYWPRLAEAHGLRYPAGLERLMRGRLDAMTA
jgi:hypothetical protein